MDHNAGFKFIIAVPICPTLDETWRVIDSYLELEPGGFMVGVGGRLPVISPPDEPGLVDYDKLCRFIEKLKKRYPTGFVAVDAEGGGIFNILESISPLEGARRYAGFGDSAETGERLTADLARHAELLADAAVDMNFAPLLDVPLPGYRGYAASDDRCVSDDGEEIAHFAELFIAEHRSRGIICTAKHFPGYGHLTKNPHGELSGEWEAWDYTGALAPYRVNIDGAGIDAVMLGHSTTDINRQVPATLSPAALSLLRDELGFSGIAVADELFMGAVNDYYRDPVSGRSDGDPDGEQRAVDAWRLCDLIIVSYPIQNRDGTVSGVPGGERRLGVMVSAVRRAIESGAIPPEAARSSAERLTSAGLL